MYGGPGVGGVFEEKALKFAFHRHLLNGMYENILKALPVLLTISLV